MKTPTIKSGFTPRRVLIAVLVAIACSVGALAVWFVALLTAYGATRALEMVLKQAMWVIPVAMALSLPVLLSLARQEERQGQ